MIFYDSKYKRKSYLRAFSVILAVMFMGLTVSIVLEVLFLLRENVPKAVVFDTKKSYEYYKTSLNNKKVSLTFDDGPHPVYTPAIAEILKKHDVPATFFFVGKSVLKHPDIVRDISAAGFEVGNHTLTHSPKVHSNPERLSDELRLTGKMIEVATGKHPIFYRPPFLLDIGDDPTINPNPETVPQESLLVASQDGYMTIGADIDSKDWLVSSSEELVQNVMRESSTGHIVLLHDGGQSKDSAYMLPVLEEMIITLKENGYKFVPLGELLFPPTAINLTHDLRLGATDAATGGEVSLLQWFLYSENLLDLNAIGEDFGSKTEEALTNWQRKNEAVSPSGMDAEYGMVGANTRKAVMAASSKQTNTVTASFPVQMAGVAATSNAMQKINLTAISAGLSMSKYLLLLVIVLIFVRLFSILGIYIHSLLKKKGVIIKSYPSRERGVTVLIPAHNEEENIESSILSVLRNSYRNKEIIVINDGSTDGTRRVVEDMQMRHPGEIKLINIPNKGKANALNIGINMAQYGIFISMDADTIFAPDTIKNLVRHFGDKTIGAVAGKVQTAKSNNILDVFQSIEYTVSQNIEKKVFASVNAVGVVPGPVGAWRKSAVIEAGGYSSETLVEDQDLTLSILNDGFKIIYEPQAVAYTETPHTLGDFLKQRFRWIYGTFQCAWKHKNYLIKKPLSPFSLVIMPNILLFSLVVPLFFPLVDIMLLFAIIFGAWKQALLVYAIFTAIDILYASLAFIKEGKNWKKLFFIPIQRLYYRQILYYVVLRSVLRAIEGNEESWNKVMKNGESQKYYFSNFEDAIVSEN